MSAPDRLIAVGAAIASLETASIARGVVVLDQMAKRAETVFLAARTLSPGRYLILLSGGVGEVEEAMAAGSAASHGELLDQLILRDPASELVAALANQLSAALDESLLIVETSTISSALRAADRALKDASVRLLEMRFGTGLSGKGVFTLTGSLHMVQAAEEAIREASEEGKLLRVELIAQPHPNLPAQLLGAEGAWIRGPSPAKVRT